MPLFGQEKGVSTDFNLAVLQRNESPKKGRIYTQMLFYHLTELIV